MSVFLYTCFLSKKSISSPQILKEFVTGKYRSSVSQPQKTQVGTRMAGRGPCRSDSRCQTLALPVHPQLGLQRKDGPWASPCLSSYVPRRWRLCNRKHEQSDRVQNKNTRHEKPCENFSSQAKQMMVSATMSLTFNMFISWPNIGMAYICLTVISAGVLNSVYVYSTLHFHKNYCFYPSLLLCHYAPKPQMSPGHNSSTFYYRFILNYHRLTVWNKMLTVLIFTHDHFALCLWLSCSWLLSAGSSTWWKLFNCGREFCGTNYIPSVE